MSRVPCPVVVLLIPEPSRVISCRASSYACPYRCSHYPHLNTSSPETSPRRLLRSCQRRTPMDRREGSSSRPWATGWFISLSVSSTTGVKINKERDLQLPAIQAPEHHEKYKEPDQNDTHGQHSAKGLQALALEANGESFGCCYLPRLDISSSCPRHFRGDGRHTRAVFGNTNENHVI